MPAPERIAIVGLGLIGGSLALALREFERIYLGRALMAAGGKKTAAARLLGISRKTLWEKLRAHGLSDDNLE